MGSSRTHPHSGDLCLPVRSATGTGPGRRSTSLDHSIPGGGGDGCGAGGGAAGGGAGGGAAGGGGGGGGAGGSVGGALSEPMQEARSKNMNSSTRSWAVIAVLLHSPGKVKVLASLTLVTWKSLNTARPHC